MFQKGKIKTYSEERGFGFIQIEGESRDLFFHIKDMPNRNIQPKIGEKLKFCIVEENGQLKADQMVRLDLKQTTTVLEAHPQQQSSYSNTRNSSAFNQHSSKGRILKILGVIFIALLAVFAYYKYQNYQKVKQFKTQQLIQQQARIVEQQRKALGDLPDQVSSEQSQRHLENRASQRSSVELTNGGANTQEQGLTTQFKCDGRTHCSQMHSYEEAVFFLRNCPATQMDGNHDGQPCERQFGR